MIESNVRALVSWSLLNSLRKRDKMVGNSRILSFSPNPFNIFNKTRTILINHEF